MVRMPRSLIRICRSSTGRLAVHKEKQAAKLARVAPLRAPAAGSWQQTSGVPRHLGKACISGANAKKKPITPRLLIFFY